MSKKNRQQGSPRNPTTPRDLERWQRRTLRLLTEGNYADAISSAQRVLRSPLASTEQLGIAQECIGIACSQLRQYEEAFAAFTAALALKLEDPAAWFNRAIAARYTSRFALSLRDLEQAAALDVDGLLASELAEVLPLARSVAEGERKRRGPDFTIEQLIVQEDVFQQGVQQMAQQHWSEAAALFRESIAMGDVMPQPWSNLGNCLMMQRQFDAAEAAMRRALEIDPTYAIARQNLAGMPAIRASGKLPTIRVTSPFDNRPVQGVRFLGE